MLRLELSNLFFFFVGPTAPIQLAQLCDGAPRLFDVLRTSDQDSNVARVGMVLPWAWCYPAETLVAMWK